MTSRPRLFASRTSSALAIPQSTVISIPYFSAISRTAFSFSPYPSVWRQGIRKSAFAFSSRRVSSSMVTALIPSTS